MKILCIGSSLLEITCSVKEAIKENDNIVITEKTECGGGHAGNIAYLLGKWGIETYIASMMGSDDAANKIKKEYENLGVRCDYIETSYDKQTAQQIVILNTTSKNNTTLEITSNAFLKKYAFGIDPNIIVVDGHDFNASVAAFDKYPKVKNFLMATTVNNDILELCKYVGFIVFNQKTAEQIANMTIDFNNSATLVNTYNKLKQKFNKAEIIITLGEHGSLYSINGQVKIMPVVKTNVMDTNGAGDVYTGAFIYAMARDFGLEKSVAYATIAASLSTTKVTGRMSIPNLTEVSTYYDNKFGAQNNPNNTVGNNNTNVNNATSANANTNTSSSTPNPTNNGAPEVVPNATPNQENNPNALNMNTESNNVN